jgi:hypothetical protein
VKLQEMTVSQLLELTDPELDDLSEDEQQRVVEVIAAVIDFELRHGSCRTEDPRNAVYGAIQEVTKTRTPLRKMH